MNLRFVRHIVGKDVRRLWWTIALTLALLARLVHFDSIRANATPAFDEGWLYILLPLAWSFFIALAVLEDPVVADTPFWATVPCRWPSLLAAKATLIAIVIHVPYFAACMYILHARGFAPSEYLVDLCSQQLALLALTSASLALATIVGNVTQFMAVAIALATVVAAPSLGWDREALAVYHLREFFAFLPVTIAAVWIAIAQYSRRRTSEMRLLGIAALLMATLIWWSSRERLYAVYAAVFPAPPTAEKIAVHLADAAALPEIRGRELGLKFGMASVAIPITVSGLRGNTHIRFPRIEFRDAAGNRYDAELTALPASATPCCSNMVPSWQVLAIDPAVFERIGNLPVTLQGTMFVDYYRQTAPVVTAPGQAFAITGGAHCFSDLPTRENPSDESLQVECESPDRLPAIPARVLDAARDREWSRYLSVGSPLSYPAGAWLSPVDRADTFFPLTDEEHYRYQGRGVPWQIPREAIPAAKISTQPEIPEGSSVVNYEIPNIRLSQFPIKP